MVSSAMKLPVLKLSICIPTRVEKDDKIATDTCCDPISDAAGSRHKWLKGRLSYEQNVRRLGDALE